MPANPSYHSLFLVVCGEDWRLVVMPYGRTPKEARNGGACLPIAEKIGTDNLGEMIRMFGMLYAEQSAEHPTMLAGELAIETVPIMIRHRSNVARLATQINENPNLLDELLKTPM